MRGLTLSRPTGPAAPAEAARFMPPVRAIPKRDLTSVGLRDLALEQQYAQIRFDLARYRDDRPPDPVEGQVSCPSCSAACGEDDPTCACGAFLHFHQVFTCPGCHTVVSRDARDCEGCGASFWSPVNPPRHAITSAMVADYLERRASE